MTTLRFRVAALCLAGMALTFPAAAQQAQQPAPGTQAQPREVVTATHGDWQIRCIEGSEFCAMEQIGETTDGNAALQVTVQRLAGVTHQGRTVEAALNVRTPLGVLIPYMVRMRIDQGEVMQVPLSVCVPGGCIGRVPLTQQEVNALKRGATAKFGFVVSDEVLVDVSLSGFTAAYDALQPIQADQQQQPQMPAPN